MYSTYIKKATQSVFKDAFDSDVKVSKVDSPHGFVYFSTIKIINDADEKQYIFGFDDACIAELAEVFLMEENPDAEVKKDFSCEMANLIIGRAKVIAQNANLMVDIDTPTCVENPPKKFSKVHSIQYKKHNILIGEI